MRPAMTEQSRSPNKTLAICAVAGLIAVVVGGVVHGKLTQRWGPGNDLVLAAAALDSFPDAFGPWRLHDSAEMSDRVVEMLQCAGHVNRTYVNLDTAEQVNVAVIVGPPGPIAVHTPEICYSSRTYKIDEAAKKMTLSQQDAGHSFWLTKFRSKQPGGENLYVGYAWTTDGIWHASDSPRYEYGGKPFLFKIQLAGSPLRSSEKLSDDLISRFLDALLQTSWRPVVSST